MAQVGAELVQIKTSSRVDYVYIGFTGGNEAVNSHLAGAQFAVYLAGIVVAVYLAERAGYGDGIADFDKGR